MQRNSGISDSNQIRQGHEPYVLSGNLAATFWKGGLACSDHFRSTKEEKGRGSPASRVLVMDRYVVEVCKMEMSAPQPCLTAYVHVLFMSDTHHHSDVKSPVTRREIITLIKVATKEIGSRMGEGN